MLVYTPFQCLVRRVVEAAPRGGVVEQPGQRVALGVLDLEAPGKALAREDGLLERLEGTVAVK